MQVTPKIYDQYAIVAMRPKETWYKSFWSQHCAVHTAIALGSEHQLCLPQPQQVAMEGVYLRVALPLGQGEFRACKGLKINGVRHQMHTP
jgi:hypothetical protein